MLVHRHYFCQCIVALVLLFSSDGASGAEAVARKARVFGSPTANLRAGAGVEHALKQTLKEGDLLTVEESHGEWLLVSAADGQKGYIHKNLVKLEENSVAPQVTPPSTKSDEVPGRNVSLAPGNTQAVPMRSNDGPNPAAAMAAVDSGARASAVTAAGKAPSLLQMLEAHELEVKIALLAAGIAFVFGWFCGGHYYIRREHRHRRRLRL
jgi:hypothetical protein